MWQQVFQSNRFGAKNHDCDFTSSQILLVSKAAVHRPILEPTKARVPSRLAFVPRQVIVHSLINTLVEQNPHEEIASSIVSDSRIRI